MSTDVDLFSNDIQSTIQASVEYSGIVDVTVNTLGSNTKTRRACEMGVSRMN